MLQALTGFATIGALIGLGVVLAEVGFLDTAMQTALSRLAFFVASPALLFTVLSEADASQVLTPSLTAWAASVLVAGGCYILLARLIWRRDTSHTVLGALCSSYVNAGNLGLSVAAYVLDDASVIAPMLVVQLLLMQPIALGILDRVTYASKFSARMLTRRAATNPLTVATLLGALVGVSGAGVQLPHIVRDPLELLAGMAVPAMLLAYGVSLRVGPRLGTGVSAAELASVAVLKILVQPATAYLTGRFVLLLDDRALFSVTIIAVLPSAQNLFIHASRYNAAPVLARDSIFLTTILSVPCLVAIAVMLG